MTPLTLPELIAPGDERYDEARTAWNLDADLRPAAVATAASADEVVAVVEHARSAGLRVAPITTGHLAAALPSLEDTILLRTEIAEPVVIDAAERTARVPAGALWRDVVEAAAPHGLAALSGSSHDVGVVGYTLGGGLSWLAREHGLAANHVRAIEIVSADGRRVRASAGEEPELFWALRGGGANFGIVTALEIELFAITEVFAGAALWDGEHGAELLRRWAAWSADAPDEVTTSFRFLRLPPLPEIPEPLRDRPLAAVDGASLGDGAAARELLGALRDVAEPLLDTWSDMPPAGLIEIHMDPPGPVPGRGHHLLLEMLDAEGIDAFAALAGPDSGSPLLSAELRQLGGAIGRAPQGGGARASIEGAFGLFGVGAVMAPGAGKAIDAHLDRLVGAMAPWSTGRIVTSFDERGGSASRAFDDETYARLRRIRAAWDPDGILTASHAIA